jgi:hypothetical protein
MLRKMILLSVLAIALPASVLAATRVTSTIGPRLGFSTSPDQLVVGGQMDLGEVAPQVSFRPNLELGVGDNATIFSINGDFDYHFTVSGSSWRPYMGAGLGLNVLSYDAPNLSETDVSGNLIVGAIVPTRTGSQFFTEARFLLGDALLPDLKLMVGWHFRM